MKTSRIATLMRRARLHEERAEVLRDKANELYRRDELQARVVAAASRAEQAEAAGYGPHLHLVPTVTPAEPTGSDGNSRWTYVAVLTHDPHVPLQDRGQIVGVYESRRAAEHAIQTYAVSLIGADWTPVDFDLGQVQTFQRGTALHPTSAYVGGGQRPYRLGRRA